MTTTEHPPAGEAAVEELAAAAPTAQGYRKIESCHSTWIFDEAGMRFRRVLRSDGSGLPACSTDWRPYYGIEQQPEGESFAVLLNRDGSQLLRAWVHRPDCPACAESPTQEVRRA